MRQPGFNAVLWGAFAILILLGGYVMLRACDFGFHPLFGRASCSVESHAAELASEQEKEAHLRSAIHAEELRLALLPACPAPLPPKPIEQKPIVQNDIKPPKPVEEVKPKEEIKKVADLKGCWQSARGDIDIVTDDAEQKPLGTARYCYCFRSDGRGAVQILFSDGDVCRAGLFARVSPDQIFMHHDKVNCHHHPYYVATDITCGNGEASGATTCEIHNLGRNGNRSTEEFVRVSNEHCNWGG